MNSVKENGRKSKIFKIDSNSNNIINKWGKFNSSELNFEKCRNNLLDKFENLANQFAAGWKYHISNTDGIKEAWINFEDFYSEICLLAIERQLVPPVHGEIESHDITGLLPSYTITDEYRTPEQCDELLIKNVNALASKLSPNWTSAITNISNTSKAWNEFKHYFQQICAHDRSSKFFIFSFFYHFN
ncbi:unnamed protein product [Cercopithifilaria johnstoni]|uniref:Uncharacterized protein n=1 Tax=Cercopithifilaria johnstoni TaxID=2874296 RepID=A0A8J2PUU9_9BILA|nr:unnamed protein product [Cercopithifilaria johnstoni]